MAQNPFSDQSYGSDLSPKDKQAPNPFDDPEYGVKPKRTFCEAASDVGVGLLQGGAGLVKTAGDLYGLATGNMDNAASSLGKNAQEHWESKKSAGLKERIKQRSENIDAADSTLGKAWTAAKDTLTDPALALDTVASNAATMLPGAAVGRGVAALRYGMAARSAAGLTGEAAAAATQAAAKSAGTYGTVAAVGAGAAQQAADVSGGGYEAAMQKPDAVWDANPDFQEALRANGGDRAAAKHGIALSSARAAFAPAAGISALANAVPGGTYLERALVGGAARETAKAGVKYALPKAIAKGAFGEGAQETIEEGGGQYAANVANKSYVDPNQDTMENVGENAGMGFAGGLLLGGAGGAFNARKAEIEAKVETFPEHQQPAARARLNAEMEQQARAQAEGRAETLNDEEAGQPDMTQPAPPPPAWATPPEGATADSYNPDDEIAQSTGADQPSMHPVRAAVQAAADAGGSLSAAAGVAIDSGASPIPAYMPSAEQAAPVEPAEPDLVLQNRDRSSDASVRLMNEIASEPKYWKAGQSRDMTSGAPVVSGDVPPTALMGRKDRIMDGHDNLIDSQYAVLEADDVLSSNNADGTTVQEYATGVPGKLRAVAGNARAAGIKAGYGRDAAGGGKTTDAYREDLAVDAPLMGMDSDAVRAMKNPVLVRIIGKADVTGNIADRTNINPGQNLAPREQAANDAQRIDIRGMSFDASGYPTEASLMSFISQTPVSEASGLSEKGKPTRLALDRFRAATFQEAYTDPYLVEEYTNSINPDARVVLNGAAEAAGVMANLRGTGEFDVADTVTDAIRMAVNAARQEVPIENFSDTQEIGVSDEQHAETVAVAKFLSANIRSKKRIGEGLRRWGKLAIDQARIAKQNKEQGDLTGEPKRTLSRAQLFSMLGSDSNPTDQSITAPQAAPEPAAQQAEIAPERREPRSPLPARGVLAKLAQARIAKKAAEAKAADAQEKPEAAPPAPTGDKLKTNIFGLPDGVNFLSGTQAVPASSLEVGDWIVIDSKINSVEAVMPMDGQRVSLGLRSAEGRYAIEVDADTTMQRKMVEGETFTPEDGTPEALFGDLQQGLEAIKTGMSQRPAPQAEATQEEAPKPLNVIEREKQRQEAAKAEAAPEAAPLELTGQTVEEARAQADAQEAAVNAKAKADAAADAADKARRDKADVDARMEASADNFMLGQDANDAVSGQASVFDEPAQPTTTQGATNAQEATQPKQDGAQQAQAGTAQDAVTPAKAAKPRKLKPNEAEKQKALAEYFTPGNVVKSYAGHERVVSYSPPDANGVWSVTAQPVELQGDKWVDVPGAKQSQHSTQPDARALKAGAVGKADATENVAATAQSESATGQNDAKSAPSTSALQPPVATQLTPKQYHEARLKHIAESNDIPLAEVRAYYGTDAAYTEDKIQWRKDVVAAAQAGEVLTPQTIDKLLELNPRAQLPESAIPAGYRRPEARKDDKDKAQQRKDAREAGDNTAAYSEAAPAQKKTTTALDKQIMGMANDGRSARDILRTILAESDSKLNRQVAALLLKMQTIPKVEAVGRIYNRNGGLVGGVYQGSTDTVQLSLLGEAEAERTFMHEMVHAATIQSLRRGGLAAQRMKALFARVQKDKALAGEYGVTDVYEFAAEVYSNPKFRAALNSTSGNSMWQEFVNIVRSILGLSTDQTTALGKAMMAGQQVMNEDKAIRARTAERAGGEFNAASMSAQPQDFVPNADGGLDYGEITLEMGKFMRQQAGKIRLQQGVQNADGTGWGLAHIEARHGKQIKNLGYGSVSDFVAESVRGFDQIWQAGKTIQLVMARTGKASRATFLQLEIQKDGDFYRVNSVFPVSDSYLEGKAKKEGWVPLWSRYPVPANASGASGFVGQSPKAGETTPMVSDQSDSASVAPKASGTNPDVRFSRATSSVPESAAEWLSDAVIADEVENRIGSFAHQPPTRIRDTAFGQLPGVARNDNVAGAVHDGAIYLFRDQLGDREAVQRTLFHELLHYGLRKLLTKAQFTSQMLNLYHRDKAIKDEADRWAATADGARAKAQGGSDYALARGVDEALAVLAEPNGGAYLNQTARSMFVRRVTRWLANVAQFLGMDKAAAYLRSIKNEEAREYVQSIFSKLASEATGKTADWSDTSEPAFSRAAPTDDSAAQDKWQSPLASGFDDTVYKLQDKHIDTKRVIESITSYAGKISDALNVYLQEELFHGRSATKVKDFGALELKPALEKMRADGLELGDVEEYLHARHAKEANALIAGRDEGMPDGGSGMMDSEADAYMAALPAARRKKLESAAKDIDAIIAATRQLYADYGLENQETVDGWGEMFQHYVPLMREGKEEGMGIGQGFTVKGKEVKSRTGSKRKVVDILANIAAQREKVIVRGEKNRVSTALVGLASANENKDFWKVLAHVSTERVYDAAKDKVVNRPDTMFKQRDNVVTAKVKNKDGKVVEKAVVFSEDDPRAVRMAAALKNLDAGQLEGLLGASAVITRYFAAVNTQWNPVFGVVNLVRDVPNAMINLSTTPLAHQKTKIAKNTLSALAGIYQDVRAVRAGKAPASKWGKLWVQMQQDGGTTGYRELFTSSADRANELKSILNPDAWADSKWGKVFTADGQLKVPASVAKKKFGAVFGWLSDYNEAMENGVRLAAYSAALDEGMTREQAASLSKNLTVNFNRKGQVGQQAGAVYAFFNAAMQGTARMGDVLFDMDKGNIKTLRLSKVGKKVVAGGVMLGVLQALMLAAAGFGDEDPPEFLRERSLIIPVPFADKKYISIPMPLGLHVIPGLGRHATEFALSGFKDPAKRALSVVGMMADAFNPIGNAGLSMQTLAPTALDLLVALTENKDWTGKDIARRSSNKAIPGHTQWKDTATTPAKWIAEAINWISGGDEYLAGALSPTPDQIDYLFAQVAGGVGRELSKVEQAARSIVSGEELPTYKMPLAGRFYGNSSGQASEGSAFYANVDKLNAIETKVKGLRKDGRFAEASEYLRSKPEAVMIFQANAAERQIQKLKRDKRALIEKDAPRADVKAKEEQITAVMARLNRAAEARRQ